MADEARESLVLPAVVFPSLPMWSALKASHRLESCVGLRDIGGETLMGLPLLAADPAPLALLFGFCPTSPVLLVSTGEGNAGRKGASTSTRGSVS